MVALALVIGILLGLGAAWLAVRGRVSAGNAAKGELDAVRQELAGTRAELAVERRSFDDKVVNAVKAASADAMKANNTQFLELADVKLKGHVGPLRESLEKMDGQVQRLERERARSQGALGEQITQLGERTASLTTALRTPHVRGRWGEIQLKRVVELAGMLPYCDFDEQVSVTTADGRLRPDLIVRLPGGKSVIVDAKVPLAAYLDSCEAKDDTERAIHLESHARQLRDHVAKLSAKSYWQQFGDTPDYVVLFLPDEGFFRAAWEQDPSLVETAARSRVHVASPTTLIVLLQSIAYGWQQESVAEDARVIQELGRELYERVAVVGGHLTKIGNSLKGAVGAFNDTVGSLEKRFLPTARKLEGYVITDKPLPELAQVAEQPQSLQAPELGEQLRVIDAA